MAGNIYDEAIDALDEQQVGPQQDPFEAAVARIHDGRETRLRASMLERDKVDPERAAEAMRLSKETGLPTRLVEQNFDRVKLEAENGRTPYEAMFAETPALAEWASTPENAQVAADDMEQLGAIEWLVSAPGRAFSQGVNQVRFATLRHESLFRELSRAEQDQLDAYRYHMQEGGALGAGESWFRKAVTGGSQQLPNLFGASLYAAKYGAAGAAATGAVGAAVGALAGGVGAVPGALAAAPFGARAGALYGAGKFGFVIESGLALDEFLEFKDETGQTIDPAVARMAALSAGAMAAGFEAIGFEALAKTVPGLDKLTSVGARAAVKRALRQPSVRAALAEAVRTYGTTLSVETATEVAQRGVTIMAGEMAKAATDPSIPRRTGGDIVEDLTNEGIGAIEGFGIISAFGPAMGAARQQRQIQQGEATSQFFKALGGQAAASATVKRMPEAAQAFIERATKDGPIGTVYAPAEQWVQYWQSQGVDPAEIARDVIGSSDALARALATGEDLAIPTARYAVTLAATEHNAFFADELRLAPGEMNGRESREFREQVKAETAAEQAAADAATPAAQVRTAIVEKLTSAGVTPDTAQSYADLYESMFGSLGDRAGIDPRELLAEIGLTIDRPALQEARPTQRAATPATGDASIGAAGSQSPPAPASLPLEGEAAPAFGDEVPGMAALEAASAGATIEPVLGEGDQGGVEVNASGESSVSLEAMRTLQSMKERGEEWGYYDRAGRWNPVIGADAKDYPVSPGVQPGQTFGVRGPSGFTVHVDNGGRVLDTNLPTRQDGGTDGGRQGEAQGAGAGRDAGAAGAAASGEGAGTAEPLEPYANTERLGIYADALDAARSLDPNVDERLFRAEFEHRLDLYDELRSIEAEESPVVLLKRIAKLGGIYEDEGGQAGEMRRLREGQAFGKVGGVPGVLSVKKRKLENVRKKIDGKWEIRQELRGGIGLDVMLQNLQADEQWPWLQDIEDLVSFIEDVQVNGIPERLGAVADTEALEGVGIDLTRDWWNDAERQAVNMLDVEEMENDILEPFGPVDTSFDVAEFGQSLFDSLEEPGPTEQLVKADTLDTGEQQPRLPGDVGDVRDEERPMPAVAEVQDEFRLTSQVEKRKTIQRSFFQSAWHGTPHMFEEFSLHAIGSGEGAQAYGWGLYFASRREVAEHYRNYLSERTPLFEGVAPDEENSLPDALKERVGDAARLGMTDIVKGAVDAARETHVERLTEAREMVAELKRRGDPTWMSDQSTVTFLERRVGIFDKIIANGYKVNPRGRLFEVDIPDQGYLDWDKPISEQPQAVRDVIEKFNLDPTPPRWVAHQVTPDDKAAGLYQTAGVGVWISKLAHPDGRSEGWGGQVYGSQSAAQRNADARQSIGVDQEPTGQDVYNAIIRLNPTQAKDSGWTTVVQTLNDAPGSPRKASEFLAANGVNGIRYLDGVSRSSGEGSSNFVVFDDKLVQVRQFFQSEKLDAARVQAFEESVRETAGADLSVFQLRFDERRNAITLESIAVRRGAARQGLGTKVMRELTRFADVNNARIELELAERGWSRDGSEETSGVARLRQFYAGLGFVSNKGRHKDYSASRYVSMYREPTVIPSRPSNPDIMFQSDERAARRGAIRFGPGRQVSISLFEKADLTTFLHESGHLFLELMGDMVDRVKAGGTLTQQQQQLVADYNTLLEWFEVNDRGGIDTAQHEKFAAAFERYLGEGRAPSLRLQSAFSRFRAWIVGVYRSLSRLGVAFTPEVRAVVDRLLASDVAIAQANDLRNAPAMFTTAESAGMSPAEFSLYEATIAAANLTAREQLDLRLMAEVQREQTKQWKDRRAEVEGEVAAEVHAQPVYRALAAMQRGANPDGSPMVEGLDTEPLKLSKAILVARYGADYLRLFPRPYIYSAEGGLDPNFVASVFGFDSGDALLKAVEDAAPMRDVIATRTEQRMLAEHGSLLLDGSLHDAAQTAISNEDRDVIVRAELRALANLRRVAKPFQQQAEQQRREQQREFDYERRWMDAEKNLEVAIARGEKQAEIDALQDEVMNLRRKARGGAAVINAALPKHADVVAAAKERIAGMKVRQIRPDVFWHASRRAAQQALERAARQDYDGAIESKRKELLNLALYREAQRVLEDVDARVKFARGLARPSTRASIGLAGHNYLDQIDGVLDRFEFATVSQKALDRRASLIKFIEGLEAQGIPTDMPEELLNEALRTNYQNLSVEQLVGVTDGLKALVHLARLKNRLLKAAQQRELNETATEIADSIRAQFKGTPATATERDRRVSNERTRAVQDFIASHRKIASLVREMDGFEDGGPMWEAVVRPLNDAGDREAQMNAQAAERFQGLVDAAFPTAADKRALYEKTMVASVGKSLSKMERIVIALNWGNESNRDRIRRSEKWTDEQVNGILATLSESDFTFMQGVLDLINGYWEDIAAKQERVYGVAPEKVLATPIRTAFGEFAGGYFPLKYDERLSARAGAFVDVEEEGLARAAAYAQSTTKRGHTKARVEGVKLPVRRDFGVMFEHVRQVIHDLSHHEALIDVGRVLAHPTVQTAIYETHGDVVYKQLKNGVRDIAIGDVPATGAFERAINHLRQGATIAGLGWNITTALLQPIGLTQSMVRIGPKWVARGMARWLRDAATMENTAAWVRERSTFMANRGRTQQREINEIRNAVGVNTGKFSGWIDDALKGVTGGRATRQGVADSYFFLIQQAQLIADLPTWLGQYEKTLEGGADEGTAIAQADQAVLDSQGGGQVKDLAGIQRGGPMLRLWTNFYSFFNVTYNLAAESTRRTNFRKPGDIGRLMVDYLLLYSVPALMGFALREAIKPGSDEDDDENLGVELAREQAAYILGTMVITRELAGVVGGGYGYEGPAGARAFSSASRLMQQVEQGEPDAAFWRSLNDTAGAVFHYPAGQVKRTIEGFAALVEGKTGNPIALISGAPK